MSNEALRWAFNLDLGDDQALKFVLVALCDHANKNRYCWPSQQRLAFKTACSVKTVQRKLETLVSMGLISMRQRARQTSMYRILLEKNAMERHSLSLHRDGTTKSPDMERQTDVMERHRSPSNPHSKPSTDSNESVDLFPKEKIERRKKRQPMPEDWEPDASGFRYAEEKGFADRKIHELVVACRDYHLKHGTLIAGAIGLAATWRTWINNEIKFTEERKQRYGRHHETTDFDTRARRLIETARDLEDKAGIIRPSDSFRGH